MTTRTSAPRAVGGGLFSKPETKNSSAIAAIETHRFSVASGALACLASVLGKVAFDGDTAFHLLARTSCDQRLPGWIPCGTVGLAVQGVSLAGMFMVNAIMLSTFLKALQISGSTVATVTNCATNFLLSGISGRILFGERLPALWFCGATFIFSGVLLMVGGTDDKPSYSTDHKAAKRKQEGNISPTHARWKQE